MMKKFNVEELINECRKYTPLGGRLLVHALKIRQVKQEDYGFDLADTKANEGKNPAIHRVDLKKVQPKVNAKYQEAIVLQVPIEEEKLRVGDKIVYTFGCTNTFDLVKGVSTMKTWDVVAKVTESGITVDELVDVPVVATSDEEQKQVASKVVFGGYKY